VLISAEAGVPTTLPGRRAEAYVVLDAVRKVYDTGANAVEAVSSVSFAARAGEFVSILGPSGCGKSTLLMMVAGLEPLTAGRIDVAGQPITGPRADIGVIFQDPVLLPWKSVLDNVLFPIHILKRPVRDYIERARQLLAMVGLSEFSAKRPHQLSGGMRQRVVGAMALAGPPRLLIADEPTTSLDLTIQAQYLNLLKEMQERHRLAMIFVTHNLGIVARMCDRVAVMYAGRIVEIGPVRRLFTAPAHPYTQALLESIPQLGARVDRLTAIEGQPPDLGTLPSGCAFAPRCPRVMDRCREESPLETPVSDGHATRCWLHGS